MVFVCGAPTLQSLSIFIPTSALEAISCFDCGINSDGVDDDENSLVSKGSLCSSTGGLSRGAAATNGNLAKVDFGGGKGTPGFGGPTKGKAYDSGYDSDSCSRASWGSCSTGGLSYREAAKKTAFPPRGRGKGQAFVTIPVSMIDTALPPGKPAPPAESSKRWDGDGGDRYAIANAANVASSPATVGGSGAADGGRNKLVRKVPKKPSPESPRRKNDTTSASAVAAAASEDEDCPICLEAMDPADKKHPLLCPTSRCVYNFCARCVSHLIESSLDEPGEASDGNRAVVVQLHCPQCRGDLSRSIEATLLLRRHARAMSLANVPDSELSAAQLRLKYEFVKPPSAEDETAADGDMMTNRVQRARRRYDRRHFAIMSSSSAHRPGEESIEVDERQGGPAVPSLAIDTFLFGGLEGAMTEAEQTYVTKLMTSGDGDSLARAAQILHGIGDVASRNKGRMTPSVEFEAVRRERSKSPVTRQRSGASIESAASSFGSRGSLYSARSDDSAAGRRLGRRGRRSGGPNSSVAAVNRALAMAETAAARASRLRAAELEARRRLHPLPARMPRFASLRPFDPTSRGATLTFADDEWDGSIADAFGAGSGRWSAAGGAASRLGTAEREGVQNVLLAGTGGSEHATHISSPRGRVVVASVSGRAGRQGVQRGDVVTHVNGEAFDGTADDLTEWIQKEAERGGGHGAMQFVVNAEECTAEALRLRALVV